MYSQSEKTKTFFHVVPLFKKLLSVLCCEVALYPQNYTNYIQKLRAIT